MSITIRDADLKRDRVELIRFLQENLTPHADAVRFDWLYLGSPCGMARMWIALSEAGETIGVSAAFPRHFWVKGKAQQGWLLGDFCVHKHYRSLGPALSLQRTSLEALGGQDGAIWYDFPGQRMVSVYRRLDMASVGRHVRYVKLLRADEKVRKVVRHERLAIPLIQIGNWALACRFRSHSVSKGITFSLHEQEFGAEFDALDSQTASDQDVSGRRDAEYLNWRYLAHPLKTYLVVTARRGTDLLGYAIVEIDGSHAMLADLRTQDAGLTVAGMLGYAEELVRNMGVHSINAAVFEDCYLIRYLRRAGFYPRESVPVIASGIQEPNKWFLLAGDRDW